MLLERIIYPEDFPMKVSISNILEDPVHYHPDIEFLYILKGEIHLKNGCCSYVLREGDIFTNAGHEVHGITGTEGENIVAQLHISTYWFSKFFPELGDACYRTYSRRSNDPRYDTLRNLLLKILSASTNKYSGYRNECISLMKQVIRHLDQYFNLFVFDKDIAIGFENNDRTANERVGRICRYIYRYYAGNISLDDLSELEHLSPFYLSHLIKNCTGMNFREFLCFARAERSEIMLLEGDRKISRIAREVGFSTTSYYEKYFERWFGNSPEEHRRLLMPLVKSDSHPALFIDIEQAEAAAEIRRKSENIQPSDVLKDVSDSGSASGKVKIRGSFNLSVSADNAERFLTQLSSLLETLGAVPEKRTESPEDEGACSICVSFGDSEKS